jgi:preprotein translocase SecE subunit
MAKPAAKMEGPKNPPAAGGGGVPIPKSPRGPKAFFVDVIRELKKVTWPSAAETNRMTGIVLAVCAMVVLILTGMNLLVGMIMSMLTTGKV